MLTGSQNRRKSLLTNCPNYVETVHIDPLKNPSHEYPHLLGHQFPDLGVDQISVLIKTAAGGMGEDLRFVQGMQIDEHTSLAQMVLRPR